MTKTLEEELLEKKGKLEKTLEGTLEKIEREKQWLKEAEEIKEGDEAYEYKEEEIETWQRAIERDSLIAEALEEAINAIGRQLRRWASEDEEKRLREILKVTRLETGVSLE